jgi:hypothetical protein
MLTIHQIVQNHIARTAALVFDPIKMAAESDRTFRRMALRMKEDPALGVFTTHYAQALAQTLRVVPEGLHASAIQSLLLQVVTEWEDVNREFEAQLKTASTA